MDKFGEVYLDFSQNDINIDDLNLNTLWVELDKGLLSDNIGQQCESIVKLTELFDRYPLPVFVNSGFTRLARVFQNGNNFLKLQVIRVIEKNKKHLTKIINIEEILKLIFYNIHSNDAICRALTLRALGEISPIISEKHNVQHSISLALESNDETEAKEAFYAANKFCALSRYFAASLIDRISEMIEAIHTPLSRKMRLMSLLIHMHHDTALSSKASTLCKSIYNSFARQDTCKIILNTLTQIACKSLTNIPDTLSFYLELLFEEPRQKIQISILNNLYILANKVSHLWTNDNIYKLINYIAKRINYNQLVLKSSEILTELAKNSNMFFLDLFKNENKDKEEFQNFRQLVQSMIFEIEKKIAFNFCLLSTNSLLYANRYGHDFKLCVEFFEQTKNGLYSIIIDIDEAIQNLDSMEPNFEANLEYFIKILPSALKCLIDLVGINDGSFYKELFGFVLSLINSFNKHTISFYIETLLVLCSYQDINGTIFSNSEEIGREKIEGHLENECANNNSIIYEKLTLIKHLYDKLVEQNLDSVLQLKTINLIFELQVRYFYSVDSEINYTQNLAENFVKRHQNDLWSVFKLSRMCVRYTNFDLSTKIYENMSNLMIGAIHNMSTNDLGYKSWFEFMSLVCRAESQLVKYHFRSYSDMMKNLNQSLNDYTRAQMLFKSLCSRCLTHSNTLPVLENSNICFQTRFCELRCEQIKLFIHLSMSLLTYRTIPAPVFQFNSSENLAKYGRIAQQMKYSVVELQKLNQKFKDFISECFDADEHSINILNICKKQNECLIFCVNFLISPKNKSKLLDEFYANFLNSSATKNEKKIEIYPKKGPQYVQYPVELKLMENFLLNLKQKLSIICSNDSELQMHQIKQFQDIFVDFIQLPIPLPRAFFTSLQKTSIKLIVTPNNKKTNSILTIRNDQTLVVKIDGIINQHFKTKHPIRTVKKVQICLTTELDTKSIPDNKFSNIKFIDVKTMLEIPKNDYFSSNILVNFPYFGNYIIQVDLYILDNTDMIWRYTSVEKHQILVKVEEDLNRQKLFAAMAAAAVASSSNQVNNQSSRNVIDSESIEKMEIQI